MILGNDVSKYQGDIDWDVFKNNANYVVIKSSEGNGYVDPKFLRNQSESRRVGLPTGYYHFARPDLNNTPDSEATFFLKTIVELKAGEFLCLDYEATWSGSVVEWCLRFLDCLKEKTKTNPFIYLNQALIKKYNWSSVSSSYPLWVAAYTYDPNNNAFATGSWGSAAMQQWTNKQTVPGISGEVDGNVFFGTANALKKYGYVPIIAEPTPTQPDNIELEKKINELVEKVVVLGNSINQVKDKSDSLAQAVDDVKKDTEEIYKDRDEIILIKEKLTTLDGKVEMSLAKQSSSETNLKADLRALGDSTDTKLNDLAKRVKIIEDTPVTNGKIQILWKVGKLFLAKILK
jgi:GH25 family lysozyme M1 (1,4-beta-N-acetylmuramidase)/FtsZ-binding cell division protein ZapB